MPKYMKIQKKSLIQRLLKIPWNTRLKPYTTRMAKIQDPKEEKTYSNIYKEEWTQPWPMGSEIYPEVHENPRVFFSSSSSIFLESPIQYPWGVGLHHFLPVMTLCMLWQGCPTSFFIHWKTWVEHQSLLFLFCPPIPRDIIQIFIK